jgi:hypothetical protein
LIEIVCYLLWQTRRSHWNLHGGRQEGERDHLVRPLLPHVHGAWTTVTVPLSASSCTFETSRRAERMMDASEHTQTELRVVGSERLRRPPHGRYTARHRCRPPAHSSAIWRTLRRRHNGDKQTTQPRGMQAVNSDFFDAANAADLLAEAATSHTVTVRLRCARLHFRRHRPVFSEPAPDLSNYLLTSAAVSSTP